MIALLARNLALTLFLAFLVVALLAQFNPAPPPLLVDFHRAQLGIPDNATPILQRCRPVVSGIQPMAAIGLEQEPVT